MATVISFKPIQQLQPVLLKKRNVLTVRNKPTETMLDGSSVWGNVCDLYSSAHINVQYAGSILLFRILWRDGKGKAQQWVPMDGCVICRWERKWRWCRRWWRPSLDTPIACRRSFGAGANTEPRKHCMISLHVANFMTMNLRIPFARKNKYLFVLLHYCLFWAQENWDNKWISYIFRTRILFFASNVLKYPQSSLPSFAGGERQGFHSPIEQRNYYRTKGDDPQQVSLALPPTSFDKMNLWLFNSLSTRRRRSSMAGTQS